MGQKACLFSSHRGSGLVIAGLSFPPGGGDDEARPQLLMTGSLSSPMVVRESPSRWLLSVSSG